MDANQKLGCWVDLPSPQVAEIIAGSGFDFAVLDLEHGPASPETLQLQLMALAAVSRKIVRIPELNEGWVKRVLDSGADAVMVPRIETAAQAAELVQFASYAPVGRRGEGLPVVRASGWGRNSATYRKQWQAKPGIIVQIESELGLKNVAEIADVPGISQLFFGPSDFSASIGADPADIAVSEASEHVASVASNHNLEAGTIALVPGSGAKLVAQGYGHIAIASDVFHLVEALDKQLASARSEISG